MAKFSSLTSKQQLFILINVMLCVSIFISTIIMCFFFHRIESETIPGKDLMISLWILIGWYILIYTCYMLISNLIERKFFTQDNKISYADATIALKNIKVIYFFI